MEEHAHEFTAQKQERPFRGDIFILFQQANRLLPFFRRHRGNPFLFERPAQ